MTHSRLVVGQTVHARHRPKAHRLRYRIFQMLLDLDELPELDARLSLFSVDRFNLLSFHSRDHLEGRAPLRPQVEALLAQAGVVADGPVRLLCMPRVLGHAFNPLSLYFCHRADGGLAAILYEVNNTFGERHVYVLPTEPHEAHAPRLTQVCPKRFFVSPFLPESLVYRFDVRRSDAAIGVDIAVDDEAGQLLWASFRGRAAPLTDRRLLQAWAGAPLLSVKVLAAIHWEALWTWLKGAPLQARRPTAAMGVTFGGPRSATALTDAA